MKKKVKKERKVMIKLPYGISNYEKIVENGYFICRRNIKEEKLNENQ